MPTNYPGAIDTIPRPGATTYMDDTGFEGDIIVDDLADAIEAAETKIGTGASTPTANTVLRGTGTGTSAYGQIVSADLAGSIAQSKMAIPYQSSQAVGSTSGPTTNSGSFATVPEMTRTLTTVGGKLRVSATLNLSSDTLGAITTLGFSLDGATEVLQSFWSEKRASDFDIVHMRHTFTGVSAASHTVTLRWKVTAGITTAQGIAREIELEEIPA